MHVLVSHEVTITHRRESLSRVDQIPSAESEVEVRGSSEDLVEALKEVLSRLPNDVYAALKIAMGVEE